MAASKSIGTGRRGRPRTSSPATSPSTRAIRRATKGRRPLPDAGPPARTASPARPTPSTRSGRTCRRGSRGDGSKRPLVLLNHIDVVPAEREYWQEDPFGGIVKDGVIWGRGALDMKSMAVMELMTLLLLKRQGAPLKRDILFLACADEEQGGIAGIDWLDAHTRSSSTSST